MILLDTNHVSILRMPPSERRTRLVERMTLAQDEAFAIPVIVVEETMRGWLAALAKERLAQRQVAAYRELRSLFGFFATFHIAPFDRAAADRFDSLHAAQIRVATRDLKIAAISLENNALLLTANRRDFEKVPGLRFENWLE
ncbi:MAG: type II toxin-antitoxin system VapC family toxin [Planctomycetes bacterium]|nr:type II toxin-antitoxin system VapC family toxin [Planctomycetota bacterium]